MKISKQFGLTIILLLVIAGILYGYNFIISPLKNYKAYANTAFGFSFKYPPLYTLANVGPGPSDISKSPDIYLIDSNHLNAPTLTIEVMDKTTGTNLALDEYANRIWSQNKNDKNPNVAGKEVSGLTKIQLNGQPAYTFTVTGSYIDFTGGRLLDTKMRYIFISKNGNTKIHISYPADNVELDRTAKSFKLD